MTTLAGGATVLVRADGAAARLTHDRPKKRNALTAALMHELIGAPRRVSAEPGMRAIVIDAARPAFSAGLELAGTIGGDVPFCRRRFDVCTELTETIHRLPQPVIAQVEGTDNAQEGPSALPGKREPTWRGR